MIEAITGGGAIWRAVDASTIEFVIVIRTFSNAKSTLINPHHEVRALVDALCPKFERWVRHSDAPVVLVSGVHAATAVHTHSVLFRVFTCRAGNGLPASTACGATRWATLLRVVITATVAAWRSARTTALR